MPKNAALREAVARRRESRIARVTELLKLRTKRSLGRDESRELKELVALLNVAGPKTDADRRADKLARRSGGRRAPKTSKSGRTVYSTGVRSIVSGGAPGLGRR